MTARIAVLGVPGAWSTERLAAAAERQGASVAVVDARSAAIGVQAGTVRCGDVELTAMDAVLVKKLGVSTDGRLRERVAILEAIERAGVRVFSSARSITRAADRVGMTLELARSGVRMPETVITDSLEEAVRAVETAGAAVVKPVYSSKGRGFLALERGDPLRLRLRRFLREHGTMYVQRFVSTGGRDVGVAVLGGAVIGAYARVASDSWLTTTLAGGRYEAYAPTWDVAAVAVRASRAFGLDYTVVDIVPGDPPLVYEVSAFGGFRGLWEAGGIDAAQEYAAYAMAALEGAHARSS